MGPPVPEAGGAAGGAGGVGWSPCPKPPSPPTASSSAPGSASTTPPPSPATSPTSASATSTARPTSRRRRAARTATTSSTDRGSTRSWAARRRTRGSAGRSARHGLGQVLDIVPNHMAITERRNTLVVGRAGERPVEPLRRLLRRRLGPARGAGCATRCCCPILGDHYGRVLEAGELQLVRGTAARSSSATTSTRCRSRPARSTPCSAGAARRCGSTELAFIADAFGQLPARDRHRPRERRRAGTATRRCCAASSRGSVEEQPEVAAARRRGGRRDQRRPRRARRAARAPELPARVLAHRRPGARLPAVLRHQHPGRPARRGRAGVRATPTRWCSRWLTEGVIDGLRVDHPDGLRDPEEYLERLRDAAPEAWIVVEKILEPGEPLPRVWPVAGTTGYDFLNRVGGLFVDPGGRGAADRPLRRAHRRERRLRRRWCARRSCWSCGSCWRSDVNRLAELFLEVCERHRRHRDYTRHELRQAIARGGRLLPGLPHLRAGRRSARSTTLDRRYVDEAIEAAKARSARPRRRPVRLPPRPPAAARSGGELESELVMRFQQLTGPAMAKGVEDTAFYSYNRLVSLNEVGGDPGRASASPSTSSTAPAPRRQRRWPRGDARHLDARHQAQRGRAGADQPALGDPRALGRRPCAAGSSATPGTASGDCPDRNAEYLLYQTLVGAWPIDAERAAAYMEKAAREAKAHTSWTRPDPEYEAALRGLRRRPCSADPEFVADLRGLRGPAGRAGRGSTRWPRRCSSSPRPGVPDFYQGTELWDLCAWSIPTTAGRSTTSCGAACSPS